MPLFNKKEIFPDFQAAIWHITESEDFFIDLLHLNDHECEELNRIKGTKRREWLSARMLIHELSDGNNRMPMYKDEHGKPHLVSDVLKISISHSYDFSAVGFSESHIGIDIQKELAKIERIKYKFLHSKELASITKENQLAKLHFFWGAKESIYKAYGKKQLRFAEQIILEPFDIIKNSIETKGSIILSDKEIHFHIKGEKFDDYYIVYAIEI